MTTSGEKTLYCKHSPSERTMFGVELQHGYETCLGCQLPYLPGSPNSRLRLGDQLGTVPPPGAGQVPSLSGRSSGSPAYKSSTETIRGQSKPVSREAKGFFASLFDFKFTSFITLRFLGVFYAVVVILILLSSALFFFAILSAGGPYALVAIFIPIVTLVYLVLTRVCMEMIAMFFRIGENSSVMAAASTSGLAPTLLEADSTRT